jgi:hypothetical protein
VGFERWLRVCIGTVLLAGGCTMYGASVSVLRPEGSPSFTQQDQDTAKSIVVEVSRAAGFWETDTAEKLSDHESSSSYRWFVSLGAPGGGDFDQDSVDISGEMRKDRREIRVSIGDDVRGEPLPSTRKLVEDLRVALERAFPESRVTVTSRKVVRWFAP